MTSSGQTKLPTVGERLGSISAVPRKRVLANRARQYSFDLAIFELVDNSIDSWEANKSPGEDKPRTGLEIVISFHFRDSTLARMVHWDNAGGAPEERLEAFVRLGEESLGNRRIGVWGEGLKVACHALGREIDIYTQHGSIPGYCLRLGKGWLEDRSWDVPRYRAHNVEPGTTTIEIRGVKHDVTYEEIFGDDPNSLRRRLGMIYGVLLSVDGERRVSIYLETAGERALVRPHGIGTTEEIRHTFAFPPGFEPTTHKKTLRGNGAELQCKIIVGLTPIQRRDYSGVSLWGNGRLFDFAKKEYSVGFGTRGPAKLPASHPTIWRLHLWVFLSGGPEHIPWSAPAKWGYNDNNRFADVIRDFIQEVAVPYAVFTRIAKRIDLLPYSEQWNELSDDGRRREFLKYLGDLPDAESRQKEAFASVSALRRGFTPPSDLVQWNHDSDRRPPFRLPCFSESRARVVAGLITSRDRDLSRPWVETYHEISRLARGLDSSPVAIASEPQQRDYQPVPVTVRLDRRVVRALRAGSPTESISSNLTKLADRVASDTDPYLRIPQREFRDVVERAVEILREGVSGIEAVVLFGSVAKGTADRSSDVDLLLIHPNPLSAERRALELVKDLAEDSELPERYKVRPLVESPDALRRSIRDKGGKLSDMLSQGIYLYQTAEVRKWQR